MRLCDGARMARRGPKRQDELLEKLEYFTPHDAPIELENEQERNRALKFARQRGMLYVSRTYKGRLLLWRLM